MLGRRIIYALFSLPVVCFRGGGQPPHLHQYSIPAPLGDFRDVVIDRTIAGDVG